ncbi:DUF4233 domain-containing protein [Aquipuribacter nitratireducens]|uniref:DUF4233 domain-containing protein n=1 Tax=Aquipuribacter nitratireducens TaxID=650104 RepID=A0ABW0GKV5_9MICO
MRDPKRVMAATVLVFEALVVVFAALVAKDLTGLGTTTAVGGGAALAVVLVVASGVLGRPGGYWLGSLLQVVVVATGLLLPAMLLVGGVFAGLWVAAVVLGTRIERDRAAWSGGAGPSGPDGPGATVGDG